MIMYEITGNCKFMVLLRKHTMAACLVGHDLSLSIQILIQSEPLMHEYKISTASSLKSRCSAEVGDATSWLACS